MNSKIKKRVLEEANYILNTKDTIRNISNVFKVSKSTVHKDLHERLKDINGEIYDKVNKILLHHIDIRHLRGGEATKRKYLNLGQN